MSFGIKCPFLCLFWKGKDMKNKIKRTAEAYTCRSGCDGGGDGGVGGGSGGMRDFPGNPQHVKSGCV